ncbi:MAG: SDR family NAD(P)-dependent oxidoreductase [Planctomycetaceae bacterium]|jgi:UDP-glucose 4-epimerase|nr:SDR family NAD(P)-dependent oxidoreductase [Planctomycetaceae bacterium]
MKVLVTGGAGFIGSNLSKQLLQEGHDVVILDNLLSGYRCNLDAIPKAKFIEGDIRDSNSVNKAIDGCEVVFHLAASVGNKRSIDFPIDDVEINVLGTLTILEAMRKHKVRKIIVSSSAGIFGELKTLPIKEDHPVEPDSPYGCTKLCEEKLSLAYAKLYEIEAVCLRYFNVYGLNQRFDAYGNVIPIFVFKLLKGESITVFGDGEQTRDFVNVKDVVQANIVSGLNRGVSGAFNLGSGTRITINRLIEMIKSFINEPVVVKYRAERPGDVRHSLADVNALKKQLNFVPSITMEDGLREYINWVKTTL